MTTSSSKQWLPIKTAPKDETDILLWFPEREVAVSGCWLNYSGEMVEGHQITPDYYDWWIHDDLIIVDDTERDRPTHWLPLPKFPSKELANWLK